MNVRTSLLASAVAITSLVLTLSGCTKPESAAEPVASASVADSTDAIITSPNDTRVYDTLTLDNGIEVLMVSDPAVEKSAAAVSVGVGLLFDPMAYQGMAHFLEHMLFMGTENYPDVDAYMNFINENGGRRNAYTWLDITNYMFEVKNSAYEGALDRFSGFFKAPLLAPEYIEKEKNAVNAEWSMRSEMDYFGMYKLGRSLMGDHPANRFLIGNLESLADKEDSTLYDATVAFFERYYSANLMKAVLVSNRPIADLRQLASTYFSGITNKEIEDPVVVQPLDFAAAAGKLIHYVPQEDQRLLELEFIIDANVDAFKVKPNEYLAYILGSEMPGTPAVRLKELGWASALNVSASPDQFGNYGVFSLSVDLTEEGLKHRPEITDLLLGYIEMLRREGVDGRYAQEFKTSLDNRFRFLEKIDDFSYASQLAAAMQSYPTVHAIDAPYRFDGFDQQAVNAVLAQLTVDRLRVWYVSQDEPTDEQQHFYAGRYAVEPLEVADANAQLALVNRYELGLPALNTLLPESFAVSHAAAAPQHVLQEGGIDIWLQGSEVYREQPKGYTQIYLNNNAREQSANAVVLQALWSDLYSLAQTTLFTEASIAGMSANISAAHGVKLSFSGFTDKQDELIARSLEGLRLEPTQAEFEQAVDRFVRGLKNSKQQFAFRQLSPALRKLTRTGEYDDATLLAIAESAQLSDLTAFIDEQLTQSLARIYMFGNYSKADATSLAETLRKKLPALANERPYVRPGIYAATAPGTLVLQDDLPVEDLGMLDMYAGPTDSFADIARSRVLAAHLSNRAFAQLRTEEQLGYAAGAFATSVGDHPYVGFYIQTPVKAPQAMLERFERFAKEYRDDLAALSAEDFERIRAGVLTNLTEPPKNLAEEAGPFISDWIRERYQFDSKAQLVAEIEQLSLQDVITFYDETVLTAKPKRVLVQLRGRAFADEPFATIEGAQVIDDVAKFHETMELQQR